MVGWKSRLGTGYLPVARTLLYGFTGLVALALFALSVATTWYLLARTVGVNGPVPALLICSVLIVLHITFFLPRIPDPPSPSRRRSFASVRTELLSLAVADLATLASTARLNDSTPGLLSSCGGYFICRALQGVFSLGVVLVLSISVQWIELLAGACYHHHRGNRDIWTKPFDAFDWAKYAAWSSRRAESSGRIPGRNGLSRRTGSV